MVPIPLVPDLTCLLGPQVGTILMILSDSTKKGVGVSLEVLHHLEASGSPGCVAACAL